MRPAPLVSLISSLRDAGHDNRRFVVAHPALVNVPKRPIVEAGASEFSDTAGGTAVKAVGASEARVQKADIDRAVDRWLELRQEAFRCVRSRKTNSVNDNVSAPELAGHRDGRSLSEMFPFRLSQADRGRW